MGPKIKQQLQPKVNIKNRNRISSILKIRCSFTNASRIRYIKEIEKLFEDSHQTITNISVIEFKLKR
jgi:hypothetical protein